MSILLGDVPTLVKDVWVNSDFFGENVIRVESQSTPLAQISTERTNVLLISEKTLLSELTGYKS